MGTWRGSSGDVVALLPLGELVLSLTREGVLTARPTIAAGGCPCSPPLPPSPTQAWPLRSPDALEPAHPALQLPPGFQPSCWCHPDAYLNKVLLGAADGRLALCNFVAGRLVHLFPGFGAPVRCLAVSPALDVVGVGLQDGRALLHNIRFDETLAAFTHDATGGAVTALAFRTGPGQPLMVAGGLSGTLSVWDLDAKRLQALIQEAHDAAVRPLLPPPPAGVSLSVSLSCLGSAEHTPSDAPHGALENNNRLQFSEPRQQQRRCSMRASARGCRLPSPL